MKQTCLYVLCGVVLLLLSCAVLLPRCEQCERFAMQHQHPSFSTKHYWCNRCKNKFALLARSRILIPSHAKTQLVDSFYRILTSEPVKENDIVCEQCKKPGTVYSHPCSPSSHAWCEECVAHAAKMCHENVWVFPGYKIKARTPLQRAWNKRLVK